ncbi:hypothetical protein P7K49_009441 [Saguinus oedipus]|uniref:Uncharacterized protein n=1 Tax=Saguinus oedipus TaxID=9490 RepID=A0ABQ9VKR7_SAGOE|nr:hypothetical protein P7K49_009441 [Saguinus oedipus]
MPRRALGPGRSPTSLPLTQGCSVWSGATRYARRGAQHESVQSCWSTVIPCDRQVSNRPRLITNGGYCPWTPPAPQLVVLAPERVVSWPGWINPRRLVPTLPSRLARSQGVRWEATSRSAGAGEEWGSGLRVERPFPQAKGTPPPLPRRGMQGGRDSIGFVAEEQVGLSPSPRAWGVTSDQRKG